MEIAKLCFLFGAVAALSVAPAAQAASISWGTPVQIAGPSDVSTNGTLVQALNFVGTSDQTVNGVTFAAAPVNIFTGPQSWGNVDLDTKPGTWTQFVNQLGTATTGDATYDDLLQPAMFEDTGDADGKGGDIMTINNLAAGTVYEIQFWSNDSRGIPVLAGRKTTLEDVTSGNVVTVDQNDNAINTLGSHLFGTVVGDGTPLQIKLDSPASSYLLNAMQIRDLGAVPEPTTLSLGIASICMGLLATRRR